jgi:hypothetical protein
MTIYQWRKREDDSDLDLEAPVAALLHAAAAPTEPGPQPGEAAALAAFRATVRPSRRPLMHSFTPVKAALAAALSSGVLLTGGVAAAATGSLPGAAQDTARDMLSHVGVTVPGAAEQSAGHADVRGKASTDAATGGDDQATDKQHAGDGSQGKGSAVSEMAHSAPHGAGQHGAAVSTLASGGKSKAGTQGKAGQHGKSGQQGKADEEHPATSNKGTDLQPSTPAAPTHTRQDGAHRSADAGTTGAEHSSSGTGH